MKEIAAFLRSERENRGFDLQTISHRTNISVDILRSLEEGTYEHIETPLLIRSFLRTYCSALEIDPDPLIHKHEAEISSYDHQKEAIRRYGKLARSFRYRRRLGTHAWILIGTLVVGTLYGVVLFYKWQGHIKDSQLITRSIPDQEVPFDLQEEDQMHSPDGSSPQVSPAKTGRHSDDGGVYASAATVGESSPVSTAMAGNGINRSSEILPEDPPPKIVQGDQHRLEITANRRISVRLLLDSNKKPLDLSLKHGETRSWDVKETAQLFIKEGNAARVVWDGKPIAAAVKRGQAWKVHLPETAQSIKSGKKRP